MLKLIKRVLGLSLKARVMSVLNKRIEQAEKEMDAELRDLTFEKKRAIKSAKREYRVGVRVIKDTHGKSLTECGERHINSILSKVL